MKKRIFLSYGHDKFANVAKRLKQDLIDEGYDVWIDSDEIRGSQDWELKIENGIEDSDWIVLLMTEHSIRRPDGVCLDEVSYARQQGKQIAPIMIQEVKPPLCIARIEWINMMDLVNPEKEQTDESLYQKKKKDLIAILSGIYALNQESGELSLKSVLKPLDNDVFSETFKRNFCGRQQLMYYFDQWCSSDNKVLWITGSAGMGKTAFVAQLASQKECISAVHFCRYNDSDRANPKKAIMSIAYYLSTQIKEYEKKLVSIPDLHLLLEKSTSRIFDQLIVEPLSQIHDNGANTVIVIDALDEATVDGCNELADVISINAERTPKWVKFLITSREEQLLKRKLSKFRTISMEDNDICNNSKDIQQYLSLTLNELLPEGKKGTQIVNQIVEKSQGIFLYAKTIAEDIIKGRRSISDVSLFPEGLTGIYLDYFERIIGKTKIDIFRNTIRPILEVLCTTYMPIERERLLQIVNVDEYDFDDALEIIYEMFPNKNGIIEPIHKSIIDWLLDPSRSGSYKVSATKGHTAISNFCLKQIEDNKADNYTLMFLCGHLISVREKEDKLIELFTSPEFWKERQKAMDTDFLLQRMIIELTLMNDSLRKKIFQNPGFIDVLYSFGRDLFNKGLFVKLKECGFSVSLTQDMTDKDRLTALRFYYINGEYDTIGNNINLFDGNYEDKQLEPSILNMLGLATKKCGMIHLSADFYKRALQSSLERKLPLEYNIYYHLNLSRILTILCLFDKGREELKLAFEVYNKDQDWKEEIEKSERDFKSRQVELAVRYVDVETELFSDTYDSEICQKELDWADNLYSSKIRIDRYYPRHLQSKILYLLRKHEFDKIEPIFDALNESDSVEFDKIRTQYFLALYQYAIGNKKACYDIAFNQLEELKEKDTLLIERTEFFALIDTLENQDHSTEITEELRPWYKHTMSIIQKIVDKPAV